MASFWPSLPVISGLGAPTANTPLDVDVRFYDPTTGLRLFFHPDWLISCNWEIVEAGGMGQATINIADTIDDTLFAITGGDICRIWVAGEPYPRYIGQVAQPEETLDLKESRRIIAYGPMQDMNSVLMDKVLVYPGGNDLSWFFGSVLTDYETRRGISVVRDIQLTGITLETLDLSNTLCRAAMNSLMDTAASNIVWGWDIEPVAGQLRFYVRPRVVGVSSQFFVGGNVKMFSPPAEFQGIVNGVKVIGGPAKYPQLMTNPSFEQPQIPDDNTGSILVNGGFETGRSGGDDNPGGNVDTLGWDCINGASRNTYDPGSGIALGHNQSAHTGTWYLLLDHPAEECYQDFTGVTNNVQYIASLFASREQSANAVTGRMVIEGRVGLGGTVVETYTLPLAPTSSTWSGGQGTTLLAGDGLQLTVQFVDPTITAVRFRLIGDTFAGPFGLCIDDCAFFVAGALGQLGWSSHLENPTSGANAFLSIDWACQAAAWDGYYGVRAQVVANSTNRPAIAPLPGDNSGGDGYHFTVKPGQTNVPGLRIRMSPGLATGAGQARVEYREWKSDGSYSNQYYGPDTTIPNDGAWHKLNVAAAVDSNGSTATVQVTFSESGWYDVDGFTCRNEAAQEFSTGDPLGATAYLRSSNFEIYVTAESICPAGSDAYNSFADYGRREGILNNDQIVNWSADSIQTVVAYFERAAVPVQRPRLELTHETTQIPTPADGKQLRVSGLAQAVDDSWVARVIYNWAKSNLSLSIELNRERPTVAKLFTASAGGGGASGSGVGTSGASATNTSSQTNTPSAGLSWQGAWAAGTYNFGAIVTRRFGLYVSLADGVTADPATDGGTNWGCMMAPPNIDSGSVA